MTVFTSRTGSRQGLVGALKVSESFSPSLGQSISAGISEGLDAPGSAAQDLIAIKIAEETGRGSDIGVIQRFSQGLNVVLGGLLEPEDTNTGSGVPLTREAWENSSFFREGLEYLEGETELSARLRANLWDRKLERDFIYEKTGTVGAGAFIGGSFAGAMIDAKNLAVSGAVAAAFPLAAGAVGAGLALRTAKSSVQAARARAGFSSGVNSLRASWAARTATVSGEAAVSTVPSVVTGLQNSELVGQEYTASDAALDLFASVGLSVAFQNVGEAVGQAWKRYAGFREASAVGDLAFAQVSSGEKVDVGPIVAREVSEFTPVFSGESPDAGIRMSQVRTKEGKTTWEARLSDPSGERLGELLASGTNKKSVAEKARGEFLSQSVKVAEDIGVSGEELAQLKRAVRLSEEVRSFNKAKEVEKIVSKSEKVKSLKQGIKDLEDSLLGKTPEAKEKVGQLLKVERARLREFEAEVQGQALDSVNQRLSQLRAAKIEAEKSVRETQRSVAQKQLSDYAKRQLEPDLESRAARSFDPNAVVAEADRLPEEYPKPEAPIRVDEAVLQQFAEDFPDLKEQLEEYLGVLERVPGAVKNFVKCRVGL